jgi:hypothetical protein
MCRKSIILYVGRLSMLRAQPSFLLLPTPAPSRIHSFRR